MGTSPDSIDSFSPFSRLFAGRDTRSPAFAPGPFLRWGVGALFFVNILCSGNHLAAAESVPQSEALQNAFAFLPPPWTNGERMRMDVKLPNGTRIGVAMYTVQAGELNGRKIWKFTSRVFAGTEQFSRVEADAASLKPARSRWKHTVLGEAIATYSSNQVDLTVKGRPSEKFGLQGAVYDSEEVPELLRCLPLKTNFSRTINIVSSLGSGTPLPLKIDVTKIEKINVPAGAFECFKVELSSRQTYWVSADAHRYLVKFEASRVETELAGIENANSNEPVHYWSKAAGITMTAPPGWYFFESDPDDLLARVYVLDPEATAHTFVIARARESLLPDWRDSLRAWAEHELLEGSPMMRDVYARKDSWRTELVAGATGQSVVADFIEGREKKVAYQVVAFAGPEVIEFTSHIPAADLDSILPKVEDIVRSIKRF